ncbi:MAG TPA: hypothetical protein PLN21_03250 [Gemmatales bacterium]|nr:hypothetical protein [Gemmatales bacterium]
METQSLSWYGLIKGLLKLRSLVGSGTIAMQRAMLQPIVLILALFWYATGWSQDGKNSKDSKPKGTLTLLGTIKGEIDKVSDGGRKLEVKYKEMVTTTTRSSSSTTTRGSTSGKYRPPVPKEFTQKEKNQEIEVRLLDNTVIRILETSETPPPSKGTDKKKSDKGTDKNENKGDADDEHEKTKNKTPTKSAKKSSEPSLPGKPGDLSSLLKGQIIIITVYREDLPGFSRLVANTIYILGEK